MLTDYYMTNRKIKSRYDEEEERRKNRGGKRPWNRNEKTMLYIAIIGSLLLAAKYLFLK